MTKKISFFNRNSFFVFILIFYSIFCVEYVFTSKELASIKIEEDLKKSNKVLAKAQIKDAAVTTAPKKDEVPVLLSKKPRADVQQKQLSTAQQKKITQPERMVTICNDITQDMITYKKHWSGNHMPSKFIVKVNDQELKKGVPTPVKVVNDNVRISYTYEFRAMGCVYRTGGKNLEYKIPQKVEQCKSTFSWDEPNNFILEHGQLINAIDF